MPGAFWGLEKLGEGYGRGAAGSGAALSSAVGQLIQIKRQRAQDEEFRRRFNEEQATRRASLDEEKRHNLDTEQRLAAQQQAEDAERQRRIAEIEQNKVLDKLKMMAGAHARQMRPMSQREGTPVEFRARQTSPQEAASLALQGIAGEVVPGAPKKTLPPQHDVIARNSPYRDFIDEVQADNTIPDSVKRDYQRLRATFDAAIPGSDEAFKRSQIAKNYADAKSEPRAPNVSVDMQKRAMGLQTTFKLLDDMEKQLENPNLETGPGAEIVRKVKDFVKIGQNVDDVEARATLAGLFDRSLATRSGAAVTNHEALRFGKEIFNLGEPKEIAKAVLRAYRDAAEHEYESIADTAEMAQAGLPTFARGVRSDLARRRDGREKTEEAPRAPKSNASVPDDVRAAKTAYQKMTPVQQDAVKSLIKDGMDRVEAVRRVQNGS